MEAYNQKLKRKADVSLVVREQQKEKRDGLYQLALALRLKEEQALNWEENPTCFKGECLNISKKLEEFLNGQQEFSAIKIHGCYRGASKGFCPNIDWWDQEKLDWLAEISKTCSVKEIPFNHWWVEVDDQWIVDLTSDQFHPGDEENYRVVIVKIGDPRYSVLDLSPLFEE